MEPLILFEASSAATTIVSVNPAARVTMSTILVASLLILVLIFEGTGK